MRKHKAKIGDIVEVAWLDAAGEQKEDKDKLNRMEPKDLLVKNITYGLFFKEDEVAVVILQEDSEEQVDYTVIPTSWITTINKLTGGE